MSLSGRFLAMYCLLGLWAGCLFTLLIATAAAPAPRTVFVKGCPVITEKTPPDVVDRCIGGKLAAKGRFPASDLGLPADGVCEDHSNGVSWRLIKCLGTQPEAHP